MGKTAKLSFKTSGIREAITYLEAYSASLAEKRDELLRRLGEIGVREASVRFTTAMYDGVNDVDVSLETAKDGYVIIARGQAVAFIEFGAGVYHNHGEPYPKPRPEGVVKIGEYGKGYGKRQAWGFRNGGELVITHGNPAAMPMWYASEEMRKNIVQIAREVFG